MPQEKQLMPVSVTLKGQRKANEWLLVSHDSTLATFQYQEVKGQGRGRPRKTFNVTRTVPLSNINFWESKEIIAAAGEVAAATAPEPVKKPPAKKKPAAKKLPAKKKPAAKKPAAKKPEETAPPKRRKKKRRTASTTEGPPKRRKKKRKTAASGETAPPKRRKKKKKRTTDESTLFEGDKQGAADENHTYDDISFEGLDDGEDYGI